jgi:hypothetical protein
MDRRARWLVGIATAGLAAVLLSVTGGAVWAAAGVDRAVREIEHISAQRGAWSRAELELAEEESIVHAYLVEPSRDLRLALEEAGRSVAGAVDFLAAMDAGDTALARAIHERPVHPAHATMQHKIGGFADREQEEATERLAELRQRQHDLRLASFAAAGVGVVALGVFLSLVVGFQRQLIRQAEASRHQALHDPLTGLPNRELFGDRVGQAIRSADRELHTAALLLLDLDRFKDVNDTLGHHHGDRLLGEVAARLTGALRQVDTVARRSTTSAPATPRWRT